MAQHRTFAASKHGGHPPPLDREARVTDGINAAMNSVEAATPDPP
jgi:hypothetical protein